MIVLNCGLSAVFILYMCPTRLKDRVQEPFFGAMPLLVYTAERNAEKHIFHLEVPLQIWLAPFLEFLGPRIRSPQSCCMKTNLELG